MSATSNVIEYAKQQEAAQYQYAVLLCSEYATGKRIHMEDVSHDHVLEAIDEAYAHWKRENSFRLIKIIANPVVVSIQRTHMQSFETTTELTRDQLVNVFEMKEREDEKEGMQPYDMRRVYGARVL